MRDEFVRRPIRRHARQAALEQPARRKIVGGDAGQIKLHAQPLVQLVKQSIAADDERRAGAAAGIEPELTEITDARHIAVYVGLAHRHAPHRKQPAARFARDDGVMNVAFNAGGERRVRLALQRNAHPPGHRALAQQPADFRVVGGRRQLEAHAVGAPAHWTLSSSPVHAASPSG